MVYLLLKILTLTNRSRKMSRKNPLIYIEYNRRLSSYLAADTSVYVCWREKSDFKIFTIHLNFRRLLVSMEVSGTLITDQELIHLDFPEVKKAEVTASVSGSAVVFVLSVAGVGYAGEPE